MRLLRVVASAALTAAFASVVVPGLVGSQNPSTPKSVDPAAFQQVALGTSVTTMTMPLLDHAIQSAGRLDAEAPLREPLAVRLGPPAPRAQPEMRAAKAILVETWKLDNNISWYGPGFNGNGGACGMFGANGLGPEDIGVAHRTLPCGTRVTFRYNGRTVVTQVKDRGPYVDGRQFDMTRGLCEALRHCFTGGGVYYRIG
ncbi:MAG TPA: septal ring lytic transglycosylase RlpA family protein [Candidatus Limnocylindria bacterium]|nr:septal ring lytic transglycosylase RlpA family protein [Candidatus Limnocylindria bacterium]